MAEAESDVFNAAVEYGRQCSGVDRLKEKQKTALVKLISSNERWLCKHTNRYSKLYHFAGTIWTLCVVVGNHKKAT